MRFSWRQLRPAFLAIGSAFAGLGLIPAEFATAIVENAELVVSGILGAWSATAWLRNRSDNKE